MPPLLKLGFIRRTAVQLDDVVLLMCRADKGPVVPMPTLPLLRMRMASVAPLLPTLKIISAPVVPTPEVVCSVSVLVVLVPPIIFGSMIDVVNVGDVASATTVPLPLVL